jgi:hypothetical protein
MQPPDAVRRLVHEHVRLVRDAAEGDLHGPRVRHERRFTQLRRAVLRRVGDDGAVGVDDRRDVARALRAPLGALRVGRRHRAGADLVRLRFTGVEGRALVGAAGLAAGADEGRLRRARVDDDGRLLRRRADVEVDVVRPEALVELGAGGRGARRRAAPAAPPRGFMGVEPELMDLGLCRREPRDEGRRPHNGAGGCPARRCVGSGLTGDLGEPRCVGSGLTGGNWRSVVRAGDKLAPSLA